MKKIQLVLVLFIFFIHEPICFSQNKAKVDSLEKIISSSKIDTLKGKALNELFLEFEFIDPEKAGEYLNKAFSVFSKVHYKKGLAETYMYLGYFAEDQGNYLEAIHNYNLSLQQWEELKNNKGIAVSYNNLGNSFYALGNFTEALKNYFSSLKIREKMGDKEGTATSYINIGLVYYNQGNYDDAIKHYLSCLDIYKELDYKIGLGKCYSFLGLVLHKQGKLEEAITNHNESLRIRSEMGDIKGIAECYNNLGGIYASKGDNDEALKNYYASLEIKEKIGDRRGIAITYSNIGASYLSLKKYKEAEINLKKSLELLYEIGAKESIKGCYHILSVLDSAKANYKGAYENYKMFVLYRDSIDNEISRKKTIQSQMTYEFEKKEAVADAEHKKELESQKVLSEEKARKQNIIIVSIVIGLILVIVFAAIILRSLRITKKQKNTIEKQKQEVDEKNLLLNQQNEEIRTQRDEIEAQRDEIEAQRDLVTEQKEHIEEIHKEVTDSIYYAKRIQEAVLPVSDLSRSILGEHFILFKPKDIVSGDFYWTTKIKNWLIIAVADCTGHGVPGAFMSMLGISFLNEIVQKKEVHKASQILNILRDEIINALQQKGLSGEQKDGMDISLLVVNTDSNEAQWAGANNPLYIIRKFDDLKMNQFESDKSSSNLQISHLSNHFIELKGDKMPIAIYPQMREFTNHEFRLERGDQVYLITDGFVDQFGGPKGRKFMYKPFKEILLQNAEKPLSEQKNILLDAFEKWKGDYKQIDDVTVMGIKI